MEQRDAAGFIVGATADHAVAIVIGLAIGQRQAVFPQFVGALQQITVAVDVAQGRLPGIVGEEGVDALGLETGTDQGQPAHFRLHPVTDAF